MSDVTARDPYCDVKGCAELSARAHLEAHAHWGCVSPEQMTRLIEAVLAEARTAALAEAEQLIRTTELPEGHIDLFDNGADWAAGLVHGLILAAVPSRDAEKATRPVSLATPCTCKHARNWHNDGACTVGSCTCRAFAAL